MRTTTASMALMMLLPALRAQEQEKPKAPPEPTAAERLADAISTAHAKNKRVLGAFLGDDPLSASLAEALTRDRKLSRQMLYEFAVVRLDATRDRELATARGVDLTELGVPALAVLDGAGEVIATLNRNAFWSEQHDFEPATLSGVLEKLHAAPLDAEKLLADALAICKKTDRRLLLHFDAPW